MFRRTERGDDEDAHCHCNYQPRGCDSCGGRAALRPPLPRPAGVRYPHSVHDPAGRGKCWQGGEGGPRGAAGAAPAVEWLRTGRWAQGGVETHTIPGGHLEMFHDRNIHGVARLIMESIERLPR